ncbi:MAG: hypothetical protein JW836_10120 [Deltaproteobacteria bacterium]|nr:hypothetical protein [Deltaproteobacteria bacterium]
MKGLLSLQGSEMVNRILDLERADEFVRALPHIDVYWLVKKIGGDDALPLLRLASVEQWQFLLDLETWNRDRLDMEQATSWLGRLFHADPERVVKWLLGEGELFTYFYFSNKIEVRVKDKDDFFEDTSFTTFDDVYYFRALNEEERDFLGEVLSLLAEEDYLRYQAVMQGVAGTLRDELEEEIYRLRNVRIAEDGFLPYEEAVSLYAHLGPDALKAEKASLVRPETSSNLPAVPLALILQVGEKTLFMEALEQESDPVLLDRMRVEFAGLCNQIISADRVRVGDAEDLAVVCRKAAGYINAGLEKLSGGSPGSCRKYLKEKTLQQIFRIGFSLALELKWEAERWLKEAWFVRKDLKPAFWGDWGGILVGILQKRPLFYRGSSSEPPYSDFKGSADLDTCREILRQMKAVDHLLEGISLEHPVERAWTKDPLFTFHALILNFWARRMLAIQPGFAPLSLRDVTSFFRLLRSDAEGPPYGMEDFKGIFVKDITAQAQNFDPDTMKALLQALFLVWDNFMQEYAWVATGDLDGRFLKFILTSPSPRTAPR